MSWQIFNDIVGNQDLYRNKDELWNYVRQLFLCERFYILQVYL